MYGNRLPALSHITVFIVQRTFFEGCPEQNSFFVSVFSHYLPVSLVFNSLMGKKDGEKRIPEKLIKAAIPWTLTWE